MCLPPRRNPSVNWTTSPFNKLRWATLASFYRNYVEDDPRHTRAPVTGHFHCRSKSTEIESEMTRDSHLFGNAQFTTLISPDIDCFMMFIGTVTVSVKKKRRTFGISVSTTISTHTTRHYRLLCNPRNQSSLASPSSQTMSTSVTDEFQLSRLLKDEFYIKPRDKWNYGECLRRYLRETVVTGSL